METMRGRTQRRELSTAPAVACHTKPHPISFPFSLLDLKAALQFKPKKCPGATVIMIPFFNGVMEISKTAKTVNTLNLAKKRILPKK